MRRSGFPVILALAVCVAPGQDDLARARSPGDQVHRVIGAIRPLDDFEAEPQGWRFVGGNEFPGAKGSLGHDSSHSHGGKASYRLDADFRGAGAYVGTWKDLRPSTCPTSSDPGSGSGPGAWIGSA